MGCTDLIPFNDIQTACLLQAGFKCCPISAERMWTRSGGFHCRTTHACTLMVAQRTALAHYPACTSLVCSLIQNTCAKGQKETTALKWLNGKCVVAIKTLETCVNHPSIVFGDTRLALTMWANHMRLRPVYMHLCSLIGYELSSEFRALIASLVRSCSSSGAHSTNTISLLTSHCSPEWPPEEATPLNINAMCLEGFYFKQRACQHQM